MKDFNIRKPDEKLRNSIRTKIDNLNKPKGSLGMLETLAERICMVQQTLTPQLKCPCHILYGGDHGIEREGVSVSPRDVTWQQMKNFTNGGGGVNMFCRQHGFKLSIVDVGVDHDLSDNTDIINRKIAHGTKNFLYEAAMNEEEFDKAISVGVEMAERCKDKGCNIICIGEMGIANTSPSSIWMHLFGNIPLDECIGIGSGLNDDGVTHKREVLRKAVEKFNEQQTTDCRQRTKDNVKTIIRHFGGFEMVAAVGTMLRATEFGMLVMVDGFIMSACMLAASRLFPNVLDYAIFGHCGNESGHRRMLELMNVRPILNLGMRLGEGTGALCSYPIIESAVKMVNEMNNFDNAHITKYF
ncbi:nicotinate-nucleotide--dimethylbenzimidazole phosphoribosyltransferase [Prevotella sp. OH937_COT-195]|uniref:nicotinate-nucleotide--dimethylbenzimidazole phosphoribosyltransferase n=1 Tax=Prevotella sp. OH937_COT-195 TaxID=2491051 RepID=UPI000F64F1DF|nr:nicotinate-nucleotide--dimethylbenzimidazole phosphoribosyltransferase [Prevotella sp. OH937_COT-195]RRC97682.1 nicotinate-nucleotide--dimethylbenzimidazole phosphoribosyltransferase [Prevotella sp. OH937_COT-195]